MEYVQLCFLYLLLLPRKLSILSLSLSLRPSVVSPRHFFTSAITLIGYRATETNVTDHSQEARGFASIRFAGEAIISIMLMLGSSNSNRSSVR